MSEIDWSAAESKPPAPSSGGVEKGGDLARRLLYRWASLMRSMHIHDPDNEAMIYAIRTFVGLSNEMVTRQTTTHIQADGSVAFINDRRVRVESIMYKAVDRATQELRDRDVGGIAVRRHITDEDVRALMRAMLSIPKVDERGSGVRVMNQAVRDAGAQVWEFQPVMSLVSSSRKKEFEELKDVGSVVLQSYVRLVVLMRSLQSTDYRDTEALEFIRIALLRTVQVAVDMIFEEKAWFLAATVYRREGEYDQVHAVNRAYLAIALGHQLGLDRRVLMNLGFSALLCDLGMLDLDQEPLASPDYLGEEMWEEVRGHPVRSVRRLVRMLTLGPLGRDALVTAYEHHTGEDGSGYPVRVLGKRLHLFSRITAIADQYDALTTDRPWRKALTPPKALEELNRCASRFDAKLLKAFFALLTPFPVGTVVRINGGPMGVVFRASQDARLATRPIVKMCSDVNGDKVWPVALDLAQPGMDGGFMATITEALESHKVDVDVMAVLFAAEDPPAEDANEAG